MAKILVIEDEADIVQMIRKRLMDAAFEVITSSDAYQGVQLAHQQKPDLILLDLMLPAGGGITVLRNIRESAHTKSIPVVVLTAMREEGSLKQEVLDMGVEAYLHKPYEPEVLINTINGILQSRDLRDPGR